MVDRYSNVPCAWCRVVVEGSKGTCFTSAGCTGIRAAVMDTGLGFDVVVAVVKQ
jgi:hypothetical protein